ncbi:unnamed protein product [Staurois parvus]|uniref:Uncharacterized protein n=1 Tax=Staurois parvus TaxID=386267 RepID=A0ABN9GZM6_9NEOB|nr:unnamed protein product [Staurois parvus]
MKSNLVSLQSLHNLSSDDHLWLHLVLKLDEDGNVTTVDAQYVLNGRQLTKNDTKVLPILIHPVVPENMTVSSDGLMEVLKYIVVQLWKDFRKELIPILKRNGTPETTTSLSSLSTEPTTPLSSLPAETKTPTLETIKSWAIAISTVILVLLVPIGVCIKYFGKVRGIFTWIYQWMKHCWKRCHPGTRNSYTSDSVIYRPAVQTEAKAEGDPNMMGSPEREDYLTTSS